MINVLLLNGNEVASLLSMSDTVSAVEDAFSSLATGRAEIPPVINIQIPKADGEVDVKSGYIESMDAVAIKVAGGFWQNPRKLGLPSVIGTLLLLDGTNGVPLAVMDASYITAIRTGAAGAVAAKHLSRQTTETIGIIGAGTQAKMQLRGLLEVRSIRSVRICDPINPELAKTCAVDLKNEIPEVEFQAVEKPEDAVTVADVVVTVTPSQNPIVRDEWIRPGTHITAIGADAPGKQELDPLIFKRARIVVDRLSQCRLIGETQNPLNKGVISEADIHAELGEIVAGLKPGRQEDDEVTLFDSTGVGVQDIATANLVYQVAREKGIGKSMQWL